MKHYVYVLINGYGVVEYVGCTKNSKLRLQTHLCNTKSKGCGKFHGRTDITLEVVKEFSNKSEAELYEGKLKIELGFEWTENTRTSKGGKIGGKIAAKKNIESGQVYKMSEARHIPISAYRKDTDELVGNYKSQSECARQLSIHYQAINNVFRGKATHAGGYTFKKENN